MLKIALFKESKDSGTVSCLEHYINQVFPQGFTPKFAQIFADGRHLEILVRLAQLKKIEIFNG